MLREIFPIESYDKTLRLEYIKYELGKPRYEPDECRQLRLTYGRPFRVWLRLTKEQPVEEEVYLGDMPIMIGGGEFIINGAERVVVSQLHRTPGVDFVVETEGGERKLHSCRIIPERGSWIEINVTKKETLGVRIDQSGKFSAMTLLRAMDAEVQPDADILRAFYRDQDREDRRRPQRRQARRQDRRRRRRLSAGQRPGGRGDPRGRPEDHQERGRDDLHVRPDRVSRSWTTSRDPLILNSLAEDPTTSHEEALLKIYQRLRPGNPPQLEKAKELFHEKFHDPNRYRLGRVGRFRINRKFEPGHRRRRR